MKFNKLNIEVFGTSHSDEIGINIAGLPINEKIDVALLQQFVNRRRAVNSAFSTSRIEQDKIVFVKGVENDIITGDITAIIKNNNVRKKDYNNLKYIPRPSHADYSAMLKYGIEYDLSGGAEFSGRLTAPICIAGGIAKQILQKKGITVNSYISEIGGIKCLSYSDNNFTIKELEEVANKPVAVFNNEEKIANIFNECNKNCDSVGGKIETVIKGVKGGIGGNLFSGVEGELAYFLYAIPSVKAVEFGLGVDFASSFASKVNDCYRVENNKVKITSNNNGGLLGGITSGEDILARITLKPTPSIARVQKSVNLKTMENVDIKIDGRHDVCHTVRAVPVAEAVLALALIDLGV